MLVLFALLLSASPARAQSPQNALAQAQRAYDARQYEKVVKLLRPALYPRSRLASEKEEIEAYILLGKSYWWLRQLSRDPKRRQRLARLAAQQFSALLSLAPGAKLSPLIHPKPLVDFFEQVRKKLTSRTSPIRALETELEHCRKALSDTKKSFKKYRASCRNQVQITRTVKQRHYFWSFVPFGVGQFQNEQPLKGALFAAAQGATLLVNLSLFVLAESPYVLEDWGQDLKTNPRTGLTDAQAQRRAKRLQIAQIATGTVFWSLVTWGIIDAIVYYRKTTVTRKRKLIPLGDPDVELSPAFGEDRFSLGVTYRF